MAVMVVFAVLALSNAKPQAIPPDPAPQAEPSNTVIGNLVVHAARSDTETAMDRRSYSVGKDASAQSGSLADVLRNIPSVQVDPQGNLSLRGEANVTVLIDGQPQSQFTAQNLAQALQAMPADRIDRVEVLTNPPAQFRAEGTGGVINLITKTAKGAGRTGSLRISGATRDAGSATADVGYNSRASSATADLTYKHDTGVTRQSTSLLDLTSGDSLGALVKHRVSDRWQGHGSADYDLDDRTRLSASLQLSSQTFDDLSRDAFTEKDGLGAPHSAFERMSHEHQTTDNGEARASWRRTYGPGHAFSFNLNYGVTDRNDDRLDRMDRTEPAGVAPTNQTVVLDTLDRRATFAGDYERPAGGGALKMGYAFEDAPGRIAHGGDMGVAAQQGRFLARETVSEAYASYERKFKKLTVLSGVRWGYTKQALSGDAFSVPDIKHYGRVYPNLRLAYDLDNERQLIASFSRRSNRPSADQLDPFGFSSAPGFSNGGNPSLRPDDAYAYELGYQRQHGDRTVTATLFYRNIRDALTVVTAEQTDGVLLETWANAGSIRRAGAEGSVGDRLTKTLKYSFSIDTYWVEVRAINPSQAQDNSGVTGFGRANLSWEITPKDLLQLNLLANAKTLLPQGYSGATYSGNIGYRHTINAKASWSLVLQDPFNSFSPSMVFNNNGIIDRRRYRIASRALSLAFVRNFGGNPRRPDLDFASDGGG